MTARGHRKPNATGRSSGARKQDRFNKISGPFAPRPIEMLESPAYRALNGSEHKILARLEIEFSNHGGSENGRLPCTFDDFVKYGIHREAIAPSLRALQSLGFIEITERGSAGNAAWRRPHIYRLTYRHTDDENPTHDWKHVTQSGQAKQLARNARQKPEKFNSQSRKPYQTQSRKPYCLSGFSGTESGTTSSSTESGTTIYISGEDAA